MGVPDTANPSHLLETYLARRADLVRFFRLRTSSDAEAEDIVQEIFLKISGLDASSIVNPGAYLYKLGTNVLLDRVRTRRRAAARDTAYFDAHAGETHERDAAQAPSPEAVWAARRRLEEVMAVVDALPPQRRRVFVMHKIEGLSYTEVAASLGISRSGVEKHMLAALRALAKLRGS